jgi:hypothetical protein
LSDPSDRSDRSDPSEYENEGYVREAVGAGVRALRLPLAPDGLTSWGGYLEELMRAASDGDIPLLLDLLEEPSPAHARDLLEAHGRHPLLHLVVLGVGSLYRLFVNDDRLYVEYHDTPFPDETLSDACLRRLVFGTGMPAAPGECAVEQTALSGLKPSEQHALAADNAYRLLSLCKPPAISPLYLEPQRRPPGLVVDIAAPDVILPHLYGPDEDLTSTQRPGVHKAILCPAAPAYRFAFEGSLAPVLPPAPTADEYEAHTGQLYQYVAIGPGLTVEDARALEPQFEESGAYAGLRLERGWAASPAAERMLDLAQERGLPVLMPEPGADDALPPESDEWGREAWARVAEGRPDLPWARGTSFPGFFAALRMTQGGRNIVE